jgi:hypothetical protein
MRSWGCIAAASMAIGSLCLFRGFRSRASRSVHPEATPARPSIAFPAEAEACALGRQSEESRRWHLERANERRTRRLERRLTLNATSAAENPAWASLSDRRAL